jgi:sugar phosphate permease
MLALLSKAAVTTLRAAQFAAGAVGMLAALAGAAQAGSPGTTAGHGMPGINLSSLISAMALVIGGALMIHDTRWRQRVACETNKKDQTID